MKHRGTKPPLPAGQAALIPSFPDFWAFRTCDFNIPRLLCVSVQFFSLGKLKGECPTCVPMCHAEDLPDSSATPLGAGGSHRLWCPGPVPAPCPAPSQEQPRSEGCRGLPRAIHHGPSAPGVSRGATDRGCRGLPAGITPLGCPHTALQKNLNSELLGLVRLTQRYLSAL